VTEAKLKFFETPQAVVYAILEFVKDTADGEFDKDKVDDIKLILPHIGLHHSPVHTPIEAAYAQAAHDLHNSDGDLEIAENSLVSMGEDDGAYVLAWKWVTDEEAGVCSRCGDVNANNGEGYDGVCGSCADKDFEAGEVV